MDIQFKQFLFTKHILVTDENPFDQNTDPEYIFTVNLAFSRELGIRIVSGAYKANLNTFRFAAQQLGTYVPEPFYRGFPQSVVNMSTDQILFDQFYHYLQTYGYGWFDGPSSHSVFETDEQTTRTVFSENVTPKDFVVMYEQEAVEVIKSSIREILSGSRPLDGFRQNLVYYGWFDYGMDIVPERIPCKRTAIDLLYRSKNLVFTKFLDIPDVIKLLEYIQFIQYGSENLKKLNLKNRDRKLLINVMDILFVRLDVKDHLADCFEKRRIWCGLLHHLHYQPKCSEASWFIGEIRNGRNHSHMSGFESLMREGRYAKAAEYLKNAKGHGALVRNLNYILSRCKNENEVKEVLAHV